MCVEDVSVQCALQNPRRERARDLSALILFPITLADVRAVVWLATAHRVQETIAVVELQSSPVYASLGTLGGREWTLGGTARGVLFPSASA